ncbi:hypothetical protein Mcup_2029 [Metallosphaera cuprina Ar-4]|uniref:Uncharacterized protein n=1 Tax=Metallosphaera cuprina (strain Ar-4) TaxID=1006006 RepID=F4G253_METCR|nr:hypothetical protein Mcup_2029 [Metallosphaera cuprina Ar-4]
MYLAKQNKDVDLLLMSLFSRSFVIASISASDLKQVRVGQR